MTRLIGDASLSFPLLQLLVKRTLVAKLSLAKDFHAKYISPLRIEEFSISNCECPLFAISYTICFSNINYLEVDIKFIWQRKEEFLIKQYTSCLIFSSLFQCL